MSADRTPNIGSDPINPAYYGGTWCAEIIEHMPTNVGFAVKYAARLGEKDSKAQEAGKAIWYLKRQIKLLYQRGTIDTRRLFVDHAMDRVEANSDKLGPIRCEIMLHCIYYTTGADNTRLERAIKLFETYLKED